MNIYMQGDDKVSVKPHINVDRDTTSYRTPASNEKKVERNTNTFIIDISGTVMDNGAYAGHGQTAEEIMQMAEQEDVTARRNYMAVMSNSISDEDFAKLQKEGFHPGSTDIDTTVTIVDHIKAALMKGGVEVVGYTDTISDEVLCDITGSESFARELKTQFHDRDIPLTRENVVSVMEGYHQVEGVEHLTEGSTKYMIENAMIPTTENLYTAQYSATEDGDRQGKGYYADGGVTGYYAKKPEVIDMDALLPQIVKVIEESGMEVSEETIQQAQWLIEKGVPLTEDSLQRLHGIRKLEFPITYENYLKSVTAAIAEGIPARKADLTKRNTYLEEIQGKRQLEEARLQMSIEANLRLLRSGYQIETLSIGEQITALKKLEEQMAGKLVGEEDIEKATQKVSLYQTSMDIIERIQTSPISFVHQISMEDSLEIVEKKASEEKLAFEKASQKYEEFMTSPKASMGDSIKKAFRNVDDILKELNLATTDENRRAVRILGYQHQEISEGSIAEVKEKDMLLSDVLKEMKPAKVLQMIREGVNPVTMKLTELDTYLKAKHDVAEDMESYSKFLYKLENAHEITEEERDAYIGIYRLIHQLEKNDHAPISGVMQAQMELSLENLLKVMRSTRKKAMDYRVDDSFGGIEQIDTGIESITSQIEKGFRGDVADIQKILEQAGSEDAEREFEQQLFEETRKAMHAEEAVFQQLTDYELPVTPDYLMAMDTLLNASAASYKKLYSLQKEHGDETGRLESDGEKLLEQFTDKESAQKAFAEFANKVQDYLEEQPYLESAGKRYQSLDIREMSNLYKHVGFLKAIANEENYEIPVEMDGTITSINLKIIHKAGQDTKVAITFSSEYFGDTAAEFRYTQQGLDGYCICTNREACGTLEMERSLFTEELQREDVMVNTLYFNSSRELNLKDFTLRQTKERSKDADVSTATLYKTAKAFIGFIQKVGIKKGNSSYEN